MKLLVVEDDNLILEGLQELFTDEGFEVITAKDGAQGLYYALEENIDVAIIDLGLPEIGGMDIIRTIRSAHFTYPVLIVTARTRWQNRVEGLEAGADDYIDKPFHSLELVARVNAVLLRVESEHATNNSIVRSIHFTEEYHLAGVSILQYFGKLLRDKYGATPVSVSIHQEGLMVKMVITPPDGKREEVKQYLHSYGLVVRETIKPEELVHDPLQLMELKTELKMAHTRIEIQKEQLTILRDIHQSEVLSIKEEVKWLRLQVGNSISVREESLSSLVAILENVHLSNQNLIIPKLISALEQNNVEKFRESIESLKNDNPQDYGALKRYLNNIMTNVVGNAPAWIDFLAKAFPM